MKTASNAFKIAVLSGECGVPTPGRKHAAHGRAGMTFMRCPWGANPNVPDNDGYTPLHDVAEMGDCPPARAMLHALLAAGADPSRQEKNGRTPSELAESMGCTMPSFQTTLPQSPSSSRAVDDFATIRARIRDLHLDE